jgi:hypothetical protein
LVDDYIPVEDNDTPAPTPAPEQPAKEQAAAGQNKPN